MCGACTVCRMEGDITDHLVCLFVSRKTMERVMYFLLLERKERVPSCEDQEVASVKNFKEMCTYCRRV